jgi:hypothetical protein
MHATHGYGTHHTAWGHLVCSYTAIVMAPLAAAHHWLQPPPPHPRATDTRQHHVQDQGAASHPSSTHSSQPVYISCIQLAPPHFLGQWYVMCGSMQHIPPAGRVNTKVCAYDMCTQQHIQLPFQQVSTNVDCDRRHSARMSIVPVCAAMHTCHVLLQAKSTMLLAGAAHLAPGSCPLRMITRATRAQRGSQHGSSDTAGNTATDS